MFIVEGKGHLIDDVEHTFAAADIVDAEETAEQALKDMYPEYVYFDVIDVREVADA